MKSLLFAMALLAISPQELVNAIKSIPIPTGSTVGNEIKDLTWNKLDTENFVILSISKDQGLYLAKNLEKIKEKSLARWGIPNFKFSAPCKIVCLPSKELMQKLFRLDTTYVEGENVWLLLDGNPDELIPPSIMMVCLDQYAKMKNIKIGYWASRGMATLNASVPQIKSEILSLKEEMNAKNNTLSSKNIFAMTDDDYFKQNETQRRMFDQQSTVLCLMLRNEYGSSKFLQMLNANPTEESFRKIYKFNSFEDFDKTFKRYMYYLCNDVSLAKTPDKYLRLYSK